MGGRRAQPLHFKQPEVHRPLPRPRLQALRRLPIHRVVDASDDGRALDRPWDAVGGRDASIVRRPTLQTSLAAFA